MPRGMACCTTYCAVFPGADCSNCQAPGHHAQAVVGCTLAGAAERGRSPASPAVSLGSPQVRPPCALAWGVEWLSRVDSML